MGKVLKTALKYVLIFGVMTTLVWVSLDNIETTGNESKADFILNVWGTADKTYLILAAALLVLSSVVRAERWKLLLSPLGYTTNLRNSFVAVMIGYFINLIIPRGGEVSRCYTIHRLDKIPFDKSFGTVIAERAVDVIFLLLFIGIAFLVEFGSLIDFFNSLDFSGGESDGPSPVLFVFIVVVILIVVAVLLIYFLKLDWLQNLAKKVIEVLKGVRQGLLVVFRLEKNTLFLIHSVSIWVMYYFVSYFILLAFTETSTVGMLGTLTIFAIGGIAMAMPLPGGTGSYHVLVPAGLVTLYGIVEDKATAFTIIFHGWQTLIFIIFGAISLIWSQFIRPVENGENEQQNS